jgi:hypothetical protein
MKVACFMKDQVEQVQMVGYVACYREATRVFHGILIRMPLERRRPRSDKTLIKYCVPV